MRARFTVGILAALFAVAASAYVIAAQLRTETVVDLRASDNVDIVLTEQGFEPRDIRIRPGTAVTFSTNREFRYWPASNSHPLHNLYPLFDPKEPIEPTDTWSFTFNDPGAWGYHDHMRSYFTGTIYVD